MCGFEQGHLSVMPLTGWTDGSVSTTQKRTGAYSFKCGSATQGNGWTLPANLTNLYIRFGLFWETVYDDASANTLVVFRNSDAERMFRLFGMRGAQTLRVQMWTAGAWSTVAAGTIRIPTNAWACIEMWLFLDNAGDCEVKINGVLDIDFNGDTLGDQTPASIREVFLGSDSISSYGVQTAYFDDFALNDTAGAVNNSWIGRGGIVALVPTADSAIKDEWTASAGNKWAAVDDIPANDDTDYVYESVVDEIQLFTLSDNSAPGAVQAIDVWTRAKLAAAGAGSVAIDIYTSGGHAVSGDFALDTSYVYKNFIWETDTVGAHAWDDAHLDALEAGVKVR